MRVHVESVLPCAPVDAWQAVRRSELLCEVSRPLVTFSPIDSAALPEEWQAGETVRIRCRLFGILPLGIRTLRFEQVDDATWQIQTREYDRLIRCWDHLICVRPHNSKTLYSDTVDIDAGWATLLVWLFAQWFYRHRQRRWLPIARDLAADSQS